LNQDISIDVLRSDDRLFGSSTPLDQHLLDASRSIRLVHLAHAVKELAEKAQDWLSIIIWDLVAEHVDKL